ncbi:type I polyketide synthase [Streptomyces sp. NPDC021098]|uniref:type I polyketide synthase n=1 Tax=unclassified Streptomyces TaxID=2593676 RepID=UPI0037B17F9F
MERRRKTDDTALAVVGLGCRFPGAAGTDAFWDLLMRGADAVTGVPADRFDISRAYDPTPGRPGRTVSRHGGFLDDAFGFDAAFFGIAPVEAESMDPQARLLLHVVWEALEDAGLVPERLAGSRTGVFVGQATAEYAEAEGAPAGPVLRDAVGARIRAVTAGRVSHALDLRGPSVVIDTACSSSLVAVHAARQSLLTGESDVAIAAGANIILSPQDAVAYSEGGMLSPSGRCRFGDATADGFVRSEGVGTVVLKRLDDAVRDGDPVWAVLLGSAVTCDGRASGLLMQPSVDGQAAMVHEACRSAGIRPDQLDYVEAHGTGTPVGDGVELRALAEAVGAGRARDRPLLTGSVKTNIGHAEAAAGIAGLIKTVLTVRHGVIPASLHLERRHPLLDGEASAVGIVTAARPLPKAGPAALAGVSSFGLSGTNAHVVVGEYVPPAAPQPAPAPATDRAAEPAPRLLVLSARSSAALRRMAGRYAAHLGPDGPGRADSLDAICATAATRRAAHPHRLWVVGGSHDDLADTLRALAEGRPVHDGGIGEAGFGEARRTAFVFAGQGSQWAGMARDLLEASPAFRAEMTACDRAIRDELGWSVVELLRDATTPFPTGVATVQPALWAVQVSLAAAWREAGVEPGLCLGHSMGEAAAAYVSGALSLRDAAAVICRRSSLMERAAGRGAMLAVELPARQARDVAARYGDAVCVAAENAPSACVLAGDRQALTDIAAGLEEHGVLTRMVRVDVASHSPAMDPLLDELGARLRDLAPAGTRTGMLSTVHTTPVRGPELDGTYWAENLRRVVRFAPAVRAAARATGTVFVEVGPHPLLVTAVEETLADADLDGAAVGTLHRDSDGRTDLLRATGRVFAAGGAVDWTAHYGEGHRVVPLPAYPWDAVRFRREPRRPEGGTRRAAPYVKRLDSAAWAADTWGGGIRVRGVAPVPPAVYCATMLEVAREAGHEEPLTIRQLYLGDEPLLLDDLPGADLRVSLTAPGADPAEGLRAVVEFRASGDTEWRRAAAARLVAGREEGPRDASWALDSVLDRCRDHRSADEFRALATRRGFTVGEPFRAVERLWRGSGVVAARMRRPMVAGPAVWEAGLLPLLAALPPVAPGADGRPYVPAAIESIRLLAGLPDDFWTLCRFTPERGERPARADVRMVDQDGQLLAEFSGIRMRRLGPGREAGAATGGPALRAARRGAARFAAEVRARTVPLGSRLSRLLAARTTTSRPARAASRPTRPPRPAFEPGRADSRRDSTKALPAAAAAVLGMPLGDLDPRRPLRDVGLDSLMAARLGQQLRREHGIEVTAGRLLGAESLETLTRSLTGGARG